MMMANSNDESSGSMDDLFSADDARDDLYLDLENFWRVMAEPFKEESLEDLPFMHNSEGLEDSIKAPSEGTEVTRSGFLSPSYNSEASDCRTGCLEGAESRRNSVSPGGERGRTAQPCFAENSCSGSFTDRIIVQQNGLICTNSDESLGLPQLKNEGELFWCCGVDKSSNNLCSKSSMEKTDQRNSGMKMKDSSIMNGDGAYQDMFHTGASSYEVGILDIFSENGAPFHFCSNELPFFPYNSGSKSLASDDTMTTHILGERNNFDKDHWIRKSEEEAHSDEENLTPTSEDLRVSL